MSRALSLYGVILAAGESSRMGKDKALLPWPPPLPGQTPPGTFLSAAIESLTPFTDMVIVVAGRNQANLAPIVYASGASLVVNPDPSRGQFSSLQTGLQEVLNRGRDAAVVTLVDRPPVAATTVAKLHGSIAARLIRYNSKHPGDWRDTPSSGTIRVIIDRYRSQPRLHRFDSSAQPASCRI